MVRTKVKTYRYRVGKNHYLLIRIIQLASAAAKEGNAITNNAIHVKILTKQSKRK